MSYIEKYILYTKGKPIALSDHHMKLIRYAISEGISGQAVKKDLSIPVYNQMIKSDKIKKL